MSRLPVLPPREVESYDNFEIYYQDEGEPEKVRETLSLVTERTAAKIAKAWTVSTWVRGRVYGYRKVQGAPK